jgi:hypothetical protein
VARRVVLDCDNCGGGDAETVGPFNLGNGLKAPDLCPDCQEQLNVPRLLALASEYGVSESDEPTSERRKAPATNRQPVDCPRCDQTFYAGRVTVVNHLQRVHGLTLYDASREVPFEGVGAECGLCDYYGPAHGMPAHVRWHKEREEAA